MSCNRGEELLDLFDVNYGEAPPRLPRQNDASGPGSTDLASNIALPKCRAQDRMRVANRARRLLPLEQLTRDGMLFRPLKAPRLTQPEAFPPSQRLRLELTAICASIVPA